MNDFVADVNARRFVPAPVPSSAVITEKGVRKRDKDRRELDDVCGSRRTEHSAVAGTNNQTTSGSRFGKNPPKKCELNSINTNSKLSPRLHIVPNSLPVLRGLTSGCDDVLQPQKQCFFFFHQHHRFPPVVSSYLSSPGPSPVIPPRKTRAGKSYLSLKATTSVGTAVLRRRLRDIAREQILWILPFSRKSTQQFLPVNSG